MWLPELGPRALGEADELAHPRQRVEGRLVRLHDERRHERRAARVRLVAPVLYLLLAIVARDARDDAVQRVPHRRGKQARRTYRQR